MGKLKAASLFSGCGGIDLGMTGGFEYLGKKYSRHPIEIVYALDNDRYVCEVFNENFRIDCICKDIRKVKGTEIPPHHILTGGFPCQSFSIVAQNPPRLGYKDANGQMFFEMCRILRVRKPICFIAENVKGILSANKKMAFPLILENFRKASYHVKYALLNASDFGVPQKRERVFIVGFRNLEIAGNFEFPKPTTENAKIPLSEAILPEKRIEDKYYFSERAIRGMKRVKEKMNKGRVQDINGPCNTISAHLAKVSLNSVDPVLKIAGRYRRFTPVEAARIQSFPGDFVFPGTDTKKYRAIGNAVPPVLMWHVTKELIKAFRKTDKKILNSKPYRTKKEIRSYNMSKIRGCDTQLEISLRKLLWSKGYRFMKNCKDVYGKPDIVFKSRKLAIFLDSGFWHGKEFEKTISRIKTNRSYWEEKIARNIERDKEVTKQLNREGWEVLRFWDDEIKRNKERIVEIISKHLSKRYHKKK